MLIRIKGNDLNWSEAECDDIINNAVDIYMECRPKTKEDEPIPKKKKQEGVIENRVEEDIDFDIETFILNRQTKIKEMKESRKSSN